MTFRLVFAFLAIYLIWGSTYLAIRVAVETMPPFLMAGCRFLISGLIMAAVVPRSAWRKLDRRQWQATAISGALFFAGGNGLVSWSERNIDSGVAALVIATIPGWMITLQWIMEKRRPRPRAVLGTILGFAGVAVLMYRPSPDIEITVAAVVGLIMAAFLWSVGSLYVRSAPLPENKVLAVAMQFLCGGAVLLVLATAMGEWGEVRMEQIDTRGYMAVAYLIVFGSLIAFSAYQWLLRNVEPTLVGTYAFVNPAVAILLGWSLGGEQINANIILAGMIIVAGVVLIVPLRLRIRPFATLKGDVHADCD